MREPKVSVRELKNSSLRTSNPSMILHTVVIAADREGGREMIVVCIGIVRCSEMVFSAWSVRTERNISHRVFHSMVSKCLFLKKDDAEMVEK